MCVLALQMVNHIRSAQFHQDMIRGSLHLVTQRLSQDPAIEADLEALFDGDIIVLPLATSDLDEYEISRIQRGDVLVKQNDLANNHFLTSKLTDQPSTVLVGLLNDEQVIRVELRSITELQAQATGQLILEEYQYSGLSLEAFVDTLRPDFGYDINIMALDDIHLTNSDYARLNYGDVLLRITFDGQGADALINVPGENKVIQLGPIETFQANSIEAIITIAVIGSMLLGLGVYWVVSSFETRLRKLEQATSRLALGHMNARVAIRGMDPVSRLGQSFNKMAEHIQRLLNIQQEMVRAVSHELRTPVARIRFGVQIIEDSVMGDAFVEKQLKGMDSDIQELDELIDEILTYARLEEGGPLLDFNKQNIEDIILQVVDEARPADHITVKYAGADAKSLFSDVEYRYIHRAIQNLVGNACRYAKSEVVVSFSANADTCRVDVADDGPGIPEEDWDRVFTPFARLDDSRTRSSGGYGLGLSIVRRIAYWHGGRALINRDEKLGGAKFSLVWPSRHQNG